MGIFDWLFGKKTKEEAIENKNGFNRFFRPDGTKVEFNAKNGSTEGLLKSFYPSGEKLSEAVYENNYPISFTKFHLNGQISEIGNMNKGGITGLLKKYYESGKLAEESYWKNGKQNGEYKYYYENSSIERQGEYRNGEQHGCWKFYDESGKPKEEHYWKNGKLNGDIKFYYENGQLEQEGEYRNGEQHGCWKFYDESGKLEQEDYYEKGKIVKIKKKPQKKNQNLKHSSNSNFWWENQSKAEEQMPENKLENVYFESSDYIINTIFNSIREIICEKFDVNIFSKKFNLSEEEVDINYWYDIFLQRVKLDDVAAMYKYSKDAPFEEKLSKNIQGHFDTYKQRFGITAVADIYEIMKVRVLMFGFIHKHITKLIEENKIMSSSKDSELYKSGVSRKDLQNLVILHLIHIKASLYSSISFAMSHNISGDYISEWYPEFNDDKDSLKDINADCLSFIYKKNSGKKFDPKETYDEKTKP